MQHIAEWTERGTNEETLNFLGGIALSHAREGGQEGAKIAGLIERRDYSAICEYELNYGASTASEASNCRQAIACFSKLDFLDLGRDKKREAFRKFYETEVTCKEVNEQFRLAREGRFKHGLRFDAVLHRARLKIARVLGAVPKLEKLGYRFGPGATTLTIKRLASTVEKLQAGISCSGNLLPYASAILEELPMLSALHASEESELSWVVSVSITEGVASAVRKNAKIDRIIIKEPPLNGLIQLATGDLMKDRLHAFGINLRDQSINQELARLGSISGEFATLDLSSASDTISIELVYELLPWDWAYFLDCQRSHEIWVEGKLIKLEKFSSMGNGFTFPLESLIFWALASSATDDDFASVYGDDIIVKTVDVESVKDALHRAGFKVNLEKSYWTGKFRESCGADYYGGINIRPVYFKKVLSPVELFRVHNFYARKKDEVMAMEILANIHPDLRIFGPDGYGDGHLIDEARLTRKHKRVHSHGYGGFLFDTFSLKGRRDYRVGRLGDRVLPCYTTYTSQGERLSIPISGLEAPEVFALKTTLNMQGNTTRSWRDLRLAPEPLPENRSKTEDGGHLFTKGPSFPGTYGYKKITIYTLVNVS